MTLDEQIRAIARTEAEKVLRERIDTAVRELAETVSRPLPAESDDLLTVAQAAALLSVREATVRSWISAGRIPRRKAGRHLRVLRSDLDRFLKGSGSIDEELDLDTMAADLLKEI